MTREEAIAILEEESEFLYGEDKPHNRTAFDMAIKALSVPEREKREWIPVSERLPEIGQRVIVTYETFDESLQVRETVYDKYGFLCGHGIAWQPLPEPYKAECEDMRGGKE